MKLKVLILLLSGFLLGGCSLIPKKAGVEIISNPSAVVYIDGKEAGSTPYKNTGLKPEEVEIKLVVGSQEWKRKLRLVNNVNTVINWQFDEKNQSDGGYLLYLERTGDESRSGLMVNANPDKSAVHVDGEIKGYTPIRMDDVGQQDKQVVVSYPAYKTINVFVKPAKGYQLVIEASLEKEEVPQSPVPEVESQLSTPSASVGELKVIIKQTETGWLRVRSEASNNGAEIGRVNPGESYKLVEEKAEWWQIELTNGQKGWISSKYAEKL